MPPPARVGRVGGATLLARASWSYLALSVLTAVVLWTLGDRWWPATLLLFGPRWLLLLPLVVLVPGALLRRRVLLLPLAASAGIILAFVMGLRVGWRLWLSDDDRAPTIRVATLNTGGSDALALELPFRVRSWGADVVALQECATALADAVRRMADWHHHVAGPLCLLSRHPIVDARSTDSETLAGPRASGLGGSSQAAEYIIDAPERPLRFVNLHLETPRKGLEGLFALDLRRIGANTTLRAAESRRTRHWVRAADRAVIVAGDFNMPVESAIYRRDWSGFRNAFSDAGTGFGATRDNGWIQVRIDHVLAGDDWRITRAIVAPVVGVDHRPVIADLAFVGAATPEKPRPSR